MPKKLTAVGRDELAGRVRKIITVLDKTYPNVTCALNHETPFQLLVATILSAQCTDERVNANTPKLFQKYPTPAALAQAEQADVEAIVKPLGFFRNKATNIIGMARQLMADFGGKLPQTLDELITLPGVGRKTANVLLGTSFGIASGVVVDTHVTRISTLLGLTKAKTAEKIELDLITLLPQEKWIEFSHQLIHHGRRTCIARRPKCSECPLLPHCQRVGLPELK